MRSQIFWILGVSRDSKWEDSWLMFFIKFNKKLALTALHSAAWNHVDKVDV